MKGGKAGRKRHSASGAPERAASERGKPKKPGAKHPKAGAPKKGESRKPGFGGRPSTDMEG